MANILFSHDLPSDDDDEDYVPEEGKISIIILECKDKLQNNM